MGKMPRIQREMLACLQCGYCIDVCEAHNQTPWESVTPRGKIYYLAQVEKKNAMDRVLGRKVELSPEFVNAMFSCTGCGSCETVCHANIKLVDFWETVRTWLVEEGVAPLPAHDRLAKRIATGRNPYGEDPALRDAWWPENVKRTETPETIFYAGCTASYRMQEIAKAGVEVMDRAGVTLNTLGEDEWCCTSPALRTGQNDLTKNAAKTIVDKAGNMGAQNMVMTCAGCYKTASFDFGSHYSRADQNVMHFADYAEKLIAERKLLLRNEFKAKVTYHDPCHLGRHAGVFESPRNILGKIKGLEFVEMEMNRMESRCCGAGGGYKSAFGDLAVNVGAERIRDAEEVGAEVIVTTCPFCVLNLRQGAKQINSDVKVMDLAELLLEVTEES